MAEDIKESLARELDVPIDNIKETKSYTAYTESYDGDMIGSAFKVIDGDEESIYIVFTNTDADEAVYADIRRLADEIGYDQFSEALATSNINLFDYIDWDALVEKSIDISDRGNFLASYDGYELELDNGMYAYRIE